MIGQDKLRENLGGLRRAPRASAASPSTTCSSTARPGSARPRSRTSSRTRWARSSAPRAVPCSSGRGDLAGAALEPRGRRRALHRRDPPPAARRRGDPLPGDGGLPLDVLIGQGPGARSIRIDLPRFTLVGATTRAGLLTAPLRDRFGWSARLDYYPPEDLERDPARARRASSASSSRPRRARDRAPLARHAAHREPPAAPRARLRRGARAAAAQPSTASSRASRSSASTSTPRASTRSTARCCSRCSRSSTAARSASTRSPPRSARTAARSRTSSSPS